MRQEQRKPKETQRSKIKIKTGINGIENKETIKRINKTKNLLFGTDIQNATIVDQEKTKSY